MDLWLGEIQMNDFYTGFSRRFHGSRPAVFRVAEWLHEYNYYIAIPPQKIYKRGENPMDYVDSGDVFITKDDDPRQRIEVKGINTQFTNAMDWPYPTVLVSNKAAVDRANGEVEAYIIVSSDMNHIIIIKAETKEHWVVTDLTPKTTGKLETFYACPLEHVIFRDITRKKGQ
jgi:hypothetical protein